VRLPGGVFSIRTWIFAKNCRATGSLCGRSTGRRSVVITAWSWPAWSTRCARPSRRPARRWYGTGLWHLLSRLSPLVFLEGDPGYYSRFGFAPGCDQGFRKPSLRIPDGAFQAIKLPEYEPWMTGTLVYAEPFWRHDAVGRCDPSAWRHEGERRCAREGLLRPVFSGPWAFVPGSRPGRSRPAAGARLG
jgi:hypothetical protein